MKQPFIIGFAGFALAAFTNIAIADDIPVGNFSFEDPATSTYSVETSILDWSFNINDGVGGVQNFSSATDVTSSGTAEGSNFAFANDESGSVTIEYTGDGTGTGADTTIALPTIQSGFDYKLTVALDNRSGTTDSGNVVGLTLLGVGGSASATVLESSLPTDTFEDRSVTLTAAQIATDGLAGTQLGIELTSQASSPFQATFDNVRLTETAVPEPATWALMGFGGLIFLAGLGRMKRQV